MNELRTAPGPSAPPSQSGIDQWRQASIDIGERLTASAQWTHDQCTWLIGASGPDADASAPRVPAGGLLYQGSAGIALFLAELAARTGDTGAARAAIGGARHACREGAQLPATAFGFHSGRVGIAYACARVGHVLGERDLVDSALALLGPMHGREHEDTGIDVISGAAGAAPALLALAELFGDESLLSMATRLGDHLLASAVQEPAGWCWTAQPMCDRRLTGYAHGASGVIHAMVDLYAATGDPQYRYAAEQGLAYERSFFDPGRENWPDFRSRDVSNYYYDGRLAELQDMLRAGWRREPLPLGYMNAWCHGAPGIALARIRAHEVLGTPQLAEEARAALRSTAHSLQAGPDNGSLCHGTIGNCEPLLEASRRWPRHGWLRPVEDHLHIGLERARAVGYWPSGVADRAQDPSLLLGDAGIGYFFLRLADPSVPSVLLVRGHNTAPADPLPDAGVLRRAYVLGYFERTLATLESRCEGITESAIAAGKGSASSDVVAAAHLIGERIAAAPADQQAEMADIWAPERRRYDRALSPTPFVETWMAALVRRPLDAGTVSRHRFRLSAEAEVVVSPSGPRDLDERTHIPFLVYQHGTQVHAVPIGDFTALVLAMTEPESIESCTDRVMRAADAPPGARSKWLALVTQQVLTAYAKGVVELDSEEAA